MPTSPPTEPTLSGKYSGMCLNTAALPKPMAQPSRNTRIANHTMWIS